MAELFTLPNLFTLMMLTLLQIVLGLDNLLYVAIEAGRVRPERRAFVRRMGIGLAIGFRIVLLFLIVNMIQAFQNPLFEVNWTGFLEGSVNLHSAIVIVGGGFILYTALKEIYHMLAADHLGHDPNSAKRSLSTAIFWIVLMNLVFSFDSILSALALTDVFMVMAISIVIAGALMIYLSDYVAEFIEKNRSYQVLGLFILMIVGIVLLSEGGHLAHLKFFGYPVEPMAKTTFYFSMVVLILVDVVQSAYQKRILAAKAAREKAAADAGVSGH